MPTRSLFIDFFNRIWLWFNSPAKPTWSATQLSKPPIKPPPGGGGVPTRRMRVRTAPTVRQHAPDEELEIELLDTYIEDDDEY